MRKLIAAINMTLDGFCDHTAGIADDELHQHYNELLRQAEARLPAYARNNHIIKKYGTPLMPFHA